MLREYEKAKAQQYQALDKTGTKSPELKTTTNFYFPGGSSNGFAVSSKDPPGFNAGSIDPLMNVTRPTFNHMIH